MIKFTSDSIRRRIACGRWAIFFGNALRMHMRFIRETMDIPGNLNSQIYSKMEENTPSYEIQYRKYINAIAENEDDEWV